MRGSVCLSSALWKNGRSDSDAVWDGRSDGSRDEAGNGVWGSVDVVILGANMCRPIVTSGGLLTIGNSNCAEARFLLGEFLIL